jgi:hypothetical protein
MFSLVVNHWHKNQWFQAEGLDKVKPRILSMLSGLLANYFHDELLAGKVVFDKNREWPFYLRNLEEVLERPIKIILMVRDVRGIVSSFERLYRGRGIEYHYPFMNDDAWHATHSIEGRAKMLLAPGGVVGGAINTVRDAVRHYGAATPDRLIKVSYEQFTQDPQRVMRAVHGLAGLPEYDYDVDHVDQVTTEDDMTFHGMELHNIRPKIEHRPRDWDNLPQPLLAELGEAYADINAQDKPFEAKS